MRKEQHFNSITSQEWVDHFNKVLDSSAFPVNDNEAENYRSQNYELVNSPRHIKTCDTLDDVISISEIHDAIKALKNNNAAGPDGLSGEFFKYSALCGVRFPTEYFNKRFGSGTFPSE